MHYRVAGRGRHGVPVVCLAEPGDSSGSLVPLLRALGEQRLTFAVDLPGHGRSANPPYGRRDPGWWLLAWLERLRFERCHLVTVAGSIGVATDAVQRAPRHVTSVAALAPPPVRRHGAARNVVGTVSAAPSAPVSLRRLGSAVARARSSVAWDFQRAMHPRDMERELRFLSAPTVVVRGERDTMASGEEAATLAAIAGGTYIELPGAPRSCHLSHAAAIAGTLECFWAPLELSTNGAAPNGRARIATGAAGSRPSAAHDEPEQHA